MHYSLCLECNVNLTTLVLFVNSSLQIELLIIIGDQLNCIRYWTMSIHIYLDILLVFYYTVIIHQLECVYYLFINVTRTHVITC